jgi:hypothetical protein
MESSGNSAARLDRIEGIIEALATRQAIVEDEFARLLKAQVVMADSQAKTEATAARTAANLDRLTERVGEIGDKLNGLIGVVDGFIRAQAKE